MPKARNTGGSKGPRKKKAGASTEAPAAAPTPAVDATTVSAHLNAPHLDTSETGSPVLIGAGPPGITGSTPPGTSGSSAASSSEELVVEIQLAQGATSLRSALVNNTAAFLGGSESSSSPADFGLATVLRRYGLIEARPTHDDAQVAQDEQRMGALRQAATIGAASPEQVAARERLPSKASFVRLKFPAGTSLAEVKAALRQQPEVDKAEWVPRAAPPMALAAPLPIDPLVGPATGPIVANPQTQLETQWYLHRTRVPQAWRYSRGANVIVADIDWGFRTSHQEFVGAIERTYNAVSGLTDVTGGSSAAHGTAVLGIAGGRANNIGMVGYAPESTLWAIQADSSQSPSMFQEPWAEAIDFVARTDAGDRRKVIILEVQTSPALGNYEQVPSVHRAIRAAIAENCVVCVAAGNGNRPADRNDLGESFDPTGSILVGATAYHDTQNKRAFFSNYGSRVVVSAPGDPGHDLTCAQSSDSAYRNGFGGTSGATPKVAGVAALMLSVNPGLTHEDVRAILTGTGSPLVQDPGKPIGVFLNTEAAVAEALRRRAETAPGEALTAPDGQPIPEVTPAKQLHGIRRRGSPLSLPDERGGPLTWESAPEAAAPASYTADPTVAPRRGEQPPANDKTLKFFRRGVEGTLTQQDRILIVTQAVQMLDNFYVHRPLKEAIHAVRPIQRLRVLLRRLQQTADIPITEKDELTFHNTLTEVFNSVRDLHTNYQLPRPYRDYIAYLPFEVAHYYEGDQRRYLVTRVMPGFEFADPDFQPGVELMYWNGVAIERAVNRNSDQTAGSNEAARHARGLSALTIRPMNTALPPDADFVDLEFIPVGRDSNDPAELHQMRQYWFVRFAPINPGTAEASAGGSGARPAPPPPVAAPPKEVAAHSSLDFSRESMMRSSTILFESPEAPLPPSAAAIASPPPAPASTTVSMRDLGLAAVLGLDTAADAVREARQLIFDPASLRVAEQANVGDEVTGLQGSASPGTVSEAVGRKEIPVRVPWNAAFRANTFNVAGKPYGLINIRTFYVQDADGFVQEFIRLLEQMPETGLIIDVRGNGGGNIWASERLLQTISPIEIEPERMQFVVTTGTVDLCRNNPATSQIPLHLWRPSLEEAVETGSVYSRAFPLTDRDSCNTIGQRYYGPVALLVDGNCYSATDIFAAGFQDHGIGKVIGVSNNTGAGGANVWEHWLLTEALPSGWGLKPLPNQAAMRVAIRQCLRVGPNAGALLEDFGVVPNDVYKLQRVDVMEGDRELLAFVANHLSGQTPRSIKITGNTPSPGNPAKRQLTIETRGLDRLDFYLDNRPQRSVDLMPDASDRYELKPSVDAGVALKLQGYLKGYDRPLALYRGRIT
ncbi:subtilisin family serine protease/C-terminal processing protease CtpA/Prc [Bradyrhizobium japonicum]